MARADRLFIRVEDNDIDHALGLLQRQVKGLRSFKYLRSPVKTHGSRHRRFRKRMRAAAEKISP